MDGRLEECLTMVTLPIREAPICRLPLEHISRQEDTRLVSCARLLITPKATTYVYFYLGKQWLGLAFEILPEPLPNTICIYSPCLHVVSGQASIEFVVPKALLTARKRTPPPSSQGEHGYADA
jgi:hypothetical protein